MAFNSVLSNSSWINYSDATDYSSILEYINKKTQNLSKKDIQSKGKIIKWIN